MKPIRVEVNDRMQQGYAYYRTEPAGRNFHADFSPELTPKEMLELGVFGGRYMTDCRDEFPASWFKRANLCAERHDPDLNYFGVNASQPLAVWRAKGWIYKDDPRGWFQWYCRYYMGRRCPDDMRQIKRWSAVRRLSVRSKRIAAAAISNAAAASAKRCCIGHMIRGRYDVTFPIQHSRIVHRCRANGVRLYVAPAADLHCPHTCGFWPEPYGIRRRAMGLC